MRGDYTMMNTIRNPAFGETLLAAARVLYGAKPTNKRAAIPKGAKSEKGKGRATSKQEIPDDLKSAFNKLGPNAEERYHKVMKQYGDRIQFWD